MSVVRLRCAIYTRKSSEEGLEQNFNSLHAQREACEAYVLSQAGEGWNAIKTAYDDGGYSGGSMDRPGLQQLMADIQRGLVDVVVVYKPVFTGSTCVLMARWDPIGFMAGVERYRVTRAGLVVDNAVEIMEHPQVADYDLSSLTMVRVSSFVKKLNSEYRQRWRELTGSLMVEAAWGMTETHTSDTFTTGMQDDDFDLKSQPIFVGLPVPGTDVAIRDFATGAFLEPGQEGEICVRSPSMLKSYWNKPEATAEALRGGWLHTGDIGLMDELGYLHFLGRRKEMLKVKGMSVFPAEIEALLGQHPAVAGSGVIGRTDPERGEVPVAFVRIAPEHRGAITEAELAAWCRANMATYKAPEIRFLDELPLTATGKVRKDQLAARLEPA